MDPNRWARVNEVFAGAAELEGTAREAYLDEQCKDDAALKAEVVSLLSSSEKAGSFLDTSPSLTKHMLRDLAPETVGPWKIVRELGHGGMGTVFLVERADGAFQMQAALKLMRRGLDTDELLARFRAERQILASLEHPNIARLLDGGATDDGRPYLVMEYVEGENLLDWCIDRKLDVRARLGLFRQLAGAVQFAHRNLVVHRDIKPANVLVAKDGTPKLLDFGIAKVLGPGAKELATATGLKVMTPAYASPEQVKGGLVTTASDVWALGVLLYELLAGQRPFAGSLEELERAVLETEPVRPSLRARLSSEPSIRKHWGELDGDLDNIVLMAMHKEPARRYSSAEQLAEDLDHYLAGLPVRAQAPTLGYRLGKFVRRNRAAVIGAGVLALSLVVGTITTTWQAIRASRERARAEAARESAEELVDFMLGDLRQKLEVRASLDVLEDTAAKVQAYFATLPADDSPANVARRIKLLQQLASVRLAQGKLDDAAKLLASLRPLSTSDVTLQATTANLEAQVHEQRGELPAALEQYEKQAAFLEQRRAANGGDAKSIALSADAANDRGRVLSSLGRPADAAAQHEQAATLLSGVPPAEGMDGRKTRLTLASSYLYLGRAQEAAGEPAKAQENFRKNLELAGALAKDFPDDLELADYLAVSNNDLGRNLRLAGQPAEAEKLAAAALAISEKLLAKDPTNAIRLDGVSAGHSFLGRAKEDQGDFAGALAEFSADQRICEQLLAKDPSSAYAKSALADALTNVGRAQRRLGKLDDARRSHGRALALREELLAATPDDVVLASDVGVSHLELGRVAAADQKPRKGRRKPPEESQDAARASFAKARAFCSRVMSQEAPPAKLKARMAQVLIELGRTDEAKKLYDELEQSGAVDPELKALAKSRL